MQRAARIHIHHLHAAADTEHGNSMLECRLRPRGFHLVTRKIIADMLFRLTLIAIRVDIRPAAEQQTVDGVRITRRR